MTALSMWRWTNPAKPKSQSLQDLVDMDRLGTTNRFKRALGNVQAFLDEFTGVSDSQKIQRLGLTPVMVEAPTPYVRGWDDRFYDSVTKPLADRINRFFGNNYDD